MNMCTIDDSTCIICNLYGHSPENCTWADCLEDEEYVDNLYECDEYESDFEPVAGDLFNDENYFFEDDE